jgi:hypothetical protein
MGLLTTRKRCQDGSNCHQGAMEIRLNYVAKAQPEETRAHAKGKKRTLKRHCSTSKSPQFEKSSANSKSPTPQSPSDTDTESTRNSCGSDARKAPCNSGNKANYIHISHFTIRITTPKTQRPMKKTMLWLTK